MEILDDNDILNILKYHYIDNLLKPRVIFKFTRNDKNDKDNKWYCFSSIQKILDFLTKIISLFYDDSKFIAIYNLRDNLRDNIDEIAHKPFCLDGKKITIDTECDLLFSDQNIAEIMFKSLIVASKRKFEILKNKI